MRRTAAYKMVLLFAIRIANAYELRYLRRSACGLLGMCRRYCCHRKSTVISRSAATVEETTAIIRHCLP